MFSYKPSGVCSRNINLEVENDLIKKVEFDAGCAGNLAGISRLVVGMKPEEAVAKLKGIDCKRRGTSCPDQLARALENYASSSA